MWTKRMSGPRKKAPRTIAVIDPDRCFGAFACSICQAACPVHGCIVEVPDQDGRMVCAVRADLCIGCGLCVTLGNPTAPQQREFGCPPDYDAINMHSFEEVVAALKAAEAGQLPLETTLTGVANEVSGTSDPATAATQNS
jgi:NAD-dependent dihydropyrimidine dehydrogenase PreA subunit